MYQLNNLKKVAKESEEKGYNKVMSFYKKFNEKVDKVLSEMLGEKENEKFGIFDLWRWIKDKFKKANKEIEIKDDKLLDEDKKGKSEDVKEKKELEEEIKNLEKEKNSNEEDKK